LSAGVTTIGVVSVLVPPPPPQATTVSEKAAVSSALWISVEKGFLIIFIVLCE
jgi:hypothetical protein